MVPFQSEISSILLKLEALSQILLCHHFDGKSPSRYAFHFLMLSNQHFFLKIAFWGSLNKLPRNTIKFKSKSFHWFYPVFTFCIEACMLPLLISSSASVSTSSELFSEFVSRSCSMLKSWQLYSSQATKTQSNNFLFQRMLNHFSVIQMHDITLCYCNQQYKCTVFATAVHLYCHTHPIILLVVIWLFVQGKHIQSS